MLKYNTLIATLELVDKICELATYLTDTELKFISWLDFVGSMDDSTGTEPERIIRLRYIISKRADFTYMQEQKRNLTEHLHVSESSALIIRKLKRPAVTF